MAPQLDRGSKGSGEWKIPQKNVRKYCLLNSSNKRLQFQPGLPEGQAFIATPYQDQKAAQKHATKLTDQEGRMLDVRTEHDKFSKLFNDPRYVVFVSKFKEGDWQSRVIKHYQKNIHSFLTANTGIAPNEKTNIELTFEDGHLMAHVISNGEQYHWEACKLIE